MPEDGRPRRCQPDFWASLDEAETSGELVETDLEARAYDQIIRDEIAWKTSLEPPDESRVCGRQADGRRHSGVPSEMASTEVHEDEPLIGVGEVADELSLPAAQKDVSVLPSAPSFRPEDIDTSTPKHSLSFPCIPTPSQRTTPLPAPAPLQRASMSALHALKHTPRTLDTPPAIPSPIDTPSPSKILGEGRGRRDPPDTPVPLGSGIMGKFRGKKDLSSLTKHFEAFEKGVAREMAVQQEGGKDRKGKGRTRSKGQAPLGLGGKLFEGLRFCIPPELGAVSKHKTWWDIVCPALYPEPCRRMLSTVRSRRWEERL
jgi:DNA polymerase lambda